MDTFVDGVASTQYVSTESCTDPFSGLTEASGSNLWLDHFGPTYQGSMISLPSSSVGPHESDSSISIRDRGLSLTGVDQAFHYNPAHVVPAFVERQQINMQKRLSREPSHVSTQNTLTNPHSGVSQGSRSDVHPDTVSSSPSSSGSFRLHNPSVNLSGSKPNDSIEQTLSAFVTPRQFPFGSDGQFRPNGFTAAANQPTEESITANALSSIRCLEPQGSADTSHTSSPSPDGPELRLSFAHTGTIGLAASMLLCDNGSTSRPEGQTQSTAQKEGSPQPEEPLPSSIEERRTSPAKKRGRPKAKTSGEQEPTCGRTGEKKSARVKLSGEAKRENHVNSEQKRRDALSKLWEELRDFVRELREQELSKSGQMAYCNSWLKAMLADNERLENHLREMSA